MATKGYDAAGQCTECTRGALFAFHAATGLAAGSSRTATRLLRAAEGLMCTCRFLPQRLQHARRALLLPVVVIAAAGSALAGHVMQ